MSALEEAARDQDIRRREAIMASLAEELRERVGVDPVTGLDARGRFEERVVQEVKRGARQGHAVAVAVVDVAQRGVYAEHLPATTLEEVAHELRSELREIDTVGRVGASRFAVLLPTCDADCAAMVLDRVVERLGRLATIDLRAASASTREVLGWDLLAAAEAGLTADDLAVPPLEARLAG